MADPGYRCLHMTQEPCHLTRIMEKQNSFANILIDAFKKLITEVEASAYRKTYYLSVQKHRWAGVEGNE